MKAISKLIKGSTTLPDVVERVNEIIGRVNSLTLEEEWWVTKLRKIREENLTAVHSQDIDAKAQQNMADTITMLVDGAKYRIIHQAAGRVEISDIIMKCKDLVSTICPHTE